MTFKYLLTTFRQISTEPDVLRKLTVVKRITQNDLDTFCQLTGDTNPIHSTAVPENERMVNGALLNGIVAGLIGTKMPGQGTIVLTQRYSFPNKCRINEEIQITLRLLQNRKISLVSYECRQNDKIVFEGEAKLKTKTK